MKLERNLKQNCRGKMLKSHCNWTRLSLVVWHLNSNTVKLALAFLTLDHFISEEIWATYERDPKMLVSFVPKFLSTLWSRPFLVVFCICILQYKILRRGLWSNDIVWVLSWNTMKGSFILFTRHSSFFLQLPMLTMDVFEIKNAWFLLSLMSTWADRWLYFQINLLCFNKFLTF